MLQGSLENFALDEVLGLLSNTQKTGHLEIAGDRGSGSLQFSEGRLVKAGASNTANGVELEDVMFELLRYSDGTFTFNARDVDESEQSEIVASVLASAENRLRDWRQIEVVVPSLRHMVQPADELPADEVTINRSEWAALTTIAAGCPVSVVCDQLALGEVEGSRLVKDLAERKLISIETPGGGSSRSNGARTSTSTADEPSLGALLSDRDEARPPAPPPPAGSDLDSDFGAEQIHDTTPPAPPSPAEISEFDAEDASELMEEETSESGGLLMKYLKGDD